MGMAKKHMKRYSTSLIIAGNANPNHKEIPLHTHQNGYYRKNQKTTSVGDDVEKLEPLYSGGGNENGTVAWENSMAVPQIIKMELSYDSAIPLLDTYPKEVKAGS